MECKIILIVVALSAGFDRWSSTTLSVDKLTGFARLWDQSRGLHHQWSFQHARCLSFEFSLNKGGEMNYWG